MLFHGCGPHNRQCVPPFLFTIHRPGAAEGDELRREDRERESSTKQEGERESERGRGRGRATTAMIVCFAPSVGTNAFLDVRDVERR